MNPQIAAALSTLAFLSGCASTVTVADLRRTNEGASKYQAKMSYEVAYRIIAAESRRCFERTIPGANVYVRGDLYSDSKSAEVSIAGALMTASIAEIIFDIRATGASSAEITTFYRKKSSESIENAMRSWLEGDTSACHIEKKV